jgi:hypothetical protein
MTTPTYPAVDLRVVLAETDNHVTRWHEIVKALDIIRYTVPDLARTQPSDYLVSLTLGSVLAELDPEVAKGYRPGAGECETTAVVEGGPLMTAKAAAFTGCDDDDQLAWVVMIAYLRACRAAGLPFDAPLAAVMRAAVAVPAVCGPVLFRRTVGTVTGDYTSVGPYLDLYGRQAYNQYSILREVARVGWVREPDGSVVTVGDRDALVSALDAHRAAG